MSFEIRVARPDEAGAIVALLGAHWTAQSWSLAKYRHYYVDYPEGEAISMVALDDGAIVAHVGLLPIRISGTPAYLVLQVLVSQHYRRGGTLVEMLRASEDEARRRGAQLLCGFGNIRFSKVAARFAHWTIAGFLRFAEVEALAVADYRDRLAFEYGPAWYRWKLGSEAPVEIRPYTKDGRTYHQLLKTRGVAHVSAAEQGVPALHLFHPDRTSPVETTDWSQPFVVRPLVEGLDPRFLDLRQWYVEMGDSDTFEVV